MSQPTPPSDRELDGIRQAADRFIAELDQEYYEVLAAGSWLDSKVSEGGTSAERIQEQLDRAKETLEGIGDAQA